jgi:hypothetical protein
MRPSQPGLLHFVLLNLLLNRYVFGRPDEGRPFVRLQRDHLPRRAQPTHTPDFEFKDSRSWRQLTIQSREIRQACVGNEAALFNREAAAEKRAGVTAD